MKRTDLFTKLHDQYNILPMAIQDKEAFHHDVYEISHIAGTRDEFHRLLQERKEKRIEELNSGLELASVKIISNPALIATDQWALAIQLFRARSLDALVRYFSSYLPESHYDSDADTLDSHSVHSDLSRSTSISTAETDVNSDASSHFFLEKETIIEEPLSITASNPPEEPLSPPTTDEEVGSPPASLTDVDCQDSDIFVLDNAPSLSTASFSETEPGQVPHPPSFHHASRPTLCHGENAKAFHNIKRSHDSPCDPAEIEVSPSQPVNIVDAFTQPCTLNSFEDMGHDTPTPRPSHMTIDSTSYISAKTIAHLRRSPSPSPKMRLAHAEAREARKMSPRARKRESSPQVSRTPCEILSRIQKPMTDSMRNRQRAGQMRIEVE